LFLDLGAAGGQLLLAGGQGGALAVKLPALVFGGLAVGQEALGFGVEGGQAGVESGPGGINVLLASGQFAARFFEAGLLLAGHLLLGGDVLPLGQEALPFGFEGGAAVGQGWPLGFQGAALGGQVFLGGLEFAAEGLKFFAQDIDLALLDCHGLEGFGLSVALMLETLAVGFEGGLLGGHGGALGGQVAANGFEFIFDAELLGGGSGRDGGAGGPRRGRRLGRRRVFERLVGRSATGGTKVGGGDVQALGSGWRRLGRSFRPEARRQRGVRVRSDSIIRGIWFGARGRWRFHGDLDGHRQCGLFSGDDCIGYGRRFKSRLFGVSQGVGRRR
jgi:hypothetical protein